MKPVCILLICHKISAIMKFLQVDSLDILTSLLENRKIEKSGMVVNGKVEAYSCKPVKSDKETLRFLKSRYNPKKTGEDITKTIETAKKPILKPKTGQITKNFGTNLEEMDIDNNISLKKFSFFIEVLNLSYEDFDFKFISPRHFKCLVSHGGDRKKDLLEIRNMVNSKLESVESVENGFLDKLWRDIDHFVPLQNCEIYSYNPPREEDNLIVENKLWDLNLFFFQKRHILFLSCVATVYRP